MEHQANTTPEAVIESVPNEPPVESEHKPLKPGKWYGIIALLCGAKLFLFLLSIVLVLMFGGLLPEPWLNRWNANAPILGLLSPLCIIGGIVFGVLARNTEGKYYGYTGLVFCALYVLAVFLFLGYRKLYMCC